MQKLDFEEFKRVFSDKQQFESHNLVCNSICIDLKNASAKIEIGTYFKQLNNRMEGVYNIRLIIHYLKYKNFSINMIFDDKNYKFDADYFMNSISMLSSLGCLPFEDIIGELTDYCVDFNKDEIDNSLIFTKNVNIMTNQDIEK